MPEMLAIHHLPEMLDAPGIFADDQFATNPQSPRPHTRVPFQRGLAPTPQSRLIGEDFDKHPIAHPGVANMRFHRGDFHPRTSLVINIKNL